MPRLRLDATAMAFDSLHQYQLHYAIFIALAEICPEQNPFSLGHESDNVAQLHVVTVCIRTPNTKP